MLIYTKVVNSVRKLFGTTANVPADSDQEVVAKDNDGGSITIATGDKFVDAFDSAGNRGMKRVSDGKFVNMAIAGETKAFIPNGKTMPTENVLTQAAAPKTATTTKTTKKTTKTTEETKE